MLIKTIFFVSFLILSTSLNAALINNDTFTTDTRSGLDYLDITESTGLTYQYVTNNLRKGQQFEGWRHATQNEIESLFVSAGLSQCIPSCVANELPLAKLINLWSATVSDTNMNRTYFIYNQIYPDSTSTDSHFSGSINDAINPINIELDSAAIFDGAIAYSWSSPYMGHALVRISEVPLPTTIWLFISGFLYLSWNRKKIYF